MRRLMLMVACVLAITVPPRDARPPAPPAPSVPPALTDLHGVDELRTLFNRDAGTVRLVLLISPT